MRPAAGHRGEIVQRLLGANVPVVVFALIAAVIAALGCFVLALEGPPPRRPNTMRELVGAAGVDPRAEPPWIGDPVDDDPVALVLASTWEPAL